MIYISGGGNYLQSALLDKLFFERCEQILYIPIGLKRNFSGYEGCWEWFSLVCQKHHFSTNDVDMCLYLDEFDRLEKYDGIYIGGASDINVLYKMFSMSRFANKLVTYFKNGGNIYGGSAGGVLLGQSLDLQNKRGLSILPFSVLSHYYGNEYRIDSYFNTNCHPLIVLHEDSGVVFDGKEIMSVGYSPTIVYFTRTDSVFLNGNCQKILI